MPDDIQKIQLDNDEGARVETARSPVFPSDLKKENPLAEEREENPRIEKHSKKRDSALEKKKKKWPKIVGLVFLGLFILFLIIGIPVAILAGPTIVSAKKTYGLAKETYEFGKNQDLVKAEEKLVETKASLEETQEKYNRLSWTKFVPGLHLYYLDGKRGLEAALAGIEAAEVLLKAITPYADVLGFKGQGSFMGGTAEDRIAKAVQTLDKITPEIDRVAEKLKVAEANISQINSNRYPESFQGKKTRENIDKAKKMVLAANLAMTDAKPILEVLPDILGYPEGKKYLVIFQNDGELRPTGGFMTAFAVLSVDTGKVKAEKSDDIYGLDRKFGRDLPAPEPIEKYLPLVYSWHLRDMNLSPDFKESMMTFEKYYSDLPGEHQVDGIITVDTRVLKDLIDVLGPIEVSGFGKFTTEEDPRCNIPQVICELEFIVDKPLATHVSDRKSTILGPMMQEILYKALGSGRGQWGEIIKTGYNLLEEKHILVYFKNDQAQEAAEKFGIAGRVKDYDGDFFMINDTNFGGAKSNLYVTQEVEQEIEVKEDGTIQKKVFLVYVHPEPADDCNLESGGLCLSGILRNWFRVYVPEGSKLIEGLGSEVEIETSEDLGKTVFEGFFTLRPESRAKVILTYELPFKYQEEEGYKQFIQKQPGTKEPEYTIYFADKEEKFGLNKDTEITF